MLNIAPAEWEKDALCIEYPAHWFFPERGEPTERARDVCRRCLVQRECLTLAITEGLDQGIFGATTAKDRQRMRTAGVTLEAALEVSESRPQRERRLWLEQVAYEREHPVDPYEID